MNAEISAESRPSYEYTTFPRRFLSYRWFKPLLVFLLAGVFMLVFQIALIIVATVWAGDVNFLDSFTGAYEDMNPYTGPGALVELGTIAVLLGALALAALIVRDRPYSSYSSSRGGWNWGAFLKCLGVAVAVFALITVIQMIFVPGEEDGDGIVRFTVVGGVMCLILIPLQCVAEEYVFRGFIMQTVASWTKIPVIGIVVSAIVFAWGHPYNDIGVISIFFNGILFSVVAWQTRGLEASCAVHIVNNMLAFGFTGFGLSTATSEVDIAGLVWDVVTVSLYVAAVIFLGKKFNWFTSQGDGTAAHNEKWRAKMARKQQRRERKSGAQQPAVMAQPYAQQPYVQQPAGAQQPAAMAQPYVQQPTAQPPIQQPNSAWPEPPLRYQADQGALR